MVLDGETSTSQQVTAVCHACFNWMHQSQQSIYKRALCFLTQASVHTRLDCCNSALALVAEVYLWKLQSVHSVAAPVVSGACQCDHIPQFLKIHSGCLSINLVVFKTALMVWKCVRGAAPAYHSDLCIPCLLYTSDAADE